MANETHNRAGLGKSAAKHTALGRGLGALIPSQVPSEGDSSRTSGSAATPLDVLFPGRPAGAPSRMRGGSAKDLLTPKPSSTARSRKSGAKSSKLAPSAGTITGDREGRKGEAPLSRKGSSAVSTAAELKERGKQGSQKPVSSLIAPLSPEGEGVHGTDSAEEVQLDVQHSRVKAVASPVAHAESVGEVRYTEANVSRETLQDLVPVPGATFADIPLDYIVPNARQPREVFDEDDLAELSDSIREVGVLQPIVVRPIDFDAEHSLRLQEYLEEKPNARFELIMGERRLRASELAGCESVPAIIRQTEDEDLLRDALLENLHRAQLNPLEEASAYQQLMADFGATQEQLAKKIARSRPQIANTLRLLKLPPSVQKKVAAQVISAGHARALLSLGSVQEMEMLAERIVAEGLSVRTTEELVRLGRVKSVSRTHTPRVPVVSALGESVVSAFENLYDTRVTITEGKKKGKIVIEFAGKEDLERIKELVMRHG